MNRHLLTVALLGALANMPLAHADDAHAAVHADTMATTTLDGIVVVGVAPSMATTFITDPKLPRQPGAIWTSRKQNRLTPSATGRT